VARLYESRGYTVVARNWRSRRGEIDIVAVRGRTIVVCEVKARSGTSHGTALEAVGAVKQARLRRATLDWIEATGATGTVRFDVAAVTSGRVEVVEAAF